MRTRAGHTLLILLALMLSSCGLPAALPHDGTSNSMIIQAASAEAAEQAVLQAGGTVTRKLSIIQGVAAELDGFALKRLRANPALHLHADALVQTTSEPVPSQGTIRRETKTDGYLLYPSAATGVFQLRNRLISTPNLRCQGQQVTEQGGPLSQDPLGWGITVAIIDSGFMGFQTPSDWDSYDPGTQTLYAENSQGRCIVYRDFLPVSPENGNTVQGAPNSVDQEGHGTHVASTIADGRRDRMAFDTENTEIGIAPKANLFIARALDKDGAGTYSSVIAALEWIVANQSIYRIRVVNLSLQAPVTGPYWADPLNQAVMKAWQSGLTIVVAAGNSGPAPGTITVPGNVPYVVTVGAIRSGRYNVSGIDELAIYSSRGPTESAFVKPDVLVPASRTIAPMAETSTIAVELQEKCTYNPTNGPIPCVQSTAELDFGIGRPAAAHTYYYLSGTSMAAAEVTGVIALMLQVNPTLTNDQVKGRLLSTAWPSIEGTSNVPGYTPWEQGAGLLDAETAIFGPAQPAANVGMDLALDLVITGDPQTHYWGPTVWDEASQQFQLADPDTGQIQAVWSGGTRIWSGGTRIWSGGTRIWSGGTRIWSGSWSSEWTDSTSLWSGGTRIWSGSVPITSLTTEAAGTIIPTLDDSICGQEAHGCAVLPIVSGP